jgi:hypothetical protein
LTAGVTKGELLQKIGYFKKILYWGKYRLTVKAEEVCRPKEGCVSEGGIPEWEMMELQLVIDYCGGGGYG